MSYRPAGQLRPRLRDQRRAAQQHLRRSLLDSLRGQPARPLHHASDARELEIILTSKGIVLLRNNAKPESKSDDRPPIPPIPPSDDWRIVKPIEAPADSAAVSGLLASLSSASARDKDVRLKSQMAGVAGIVAPPGLNPLARVATVGLLAPARVFGLSPAAATVRVSVMESKRPGQPKTKKVFTIRLGQHDRAAKKLYATSQGRPRINEIDDALADLKRQVGRWTSAAVGVLDFASGDVERLEVRRLDLGEMGAGVVGLMTTPPSLARLGPAAALLGDRSTGLVLRHSGRRLEAGGAGRSRRGRRRQGQRPDEQAGRARRCWPGSAELLHHQPNCRRSTGLGWCRPQA